MGKHKRVEVEGVKLRGLRERKALSLRELAEHSGVALTTIYRLEHGKTGAWPRTVRRLAEALDVEPHELLKEGYDA